MIDTRSSCRLNILRENRDLLGLGQDDIKRAASLMDERGYEPLFAVAYLEAARLTVNVSGSRDEWNQRQAHDIAARYQARISARAAKMNETPTPR